MAAWFELELDGSQRKSKEGHNMEESGIDLQKIYAEDIPYEEVNVKVMNLENAFSGIENRTSLMMISDGLKK